MNKKTLKALKGSIEKWEKIVEGTGADKSMENCPLCKLFRYNYIEGSCKRCPVSVKSGRKYCYHTPYGKWVKGTTYIAMGIGRCANTPKQKALAQAEADFLKSLLSEEG